MTSTHLPEIEFVLAGEEETVELGRRLAGVLRRGLQVHLFGDLGSGKTTLVRGVLRGAGYTGRVKSPTYPLVEIYNLSRLNFYHFDLYRVTDPGEIDARGLREYFASDAACFVEWPERASGRLPGPDLEVRIAFDGDTARIVRLRAVTGVGETCLNELVRLSSSRGA
jgi:tRNA threonylcarbamoyladenosine biosynthesis protein TsaE